jgi:putative solute:sodium symporter small subunit
MTPENRSAYWKANLRLLMILLIIWFVVSFGFGILLVDPLNAINLGGYKLGFCSPSRARSTPSWS